MLSAETYYKGLGKKERDSKEKSCYDVLLENKKMNLSGK